MKRREITFREQRPFFPSFLVFLSAIMAAVSILTGCAASLKGLAPALEPIPVRSEYMKPISFKGVVLRIPLGEEIGKHHDGLAKIPKYSLHWQSGISFRSDECRLGASETLREYGYNVLGGEMLLFDNNKAAKAPYQLGATVVGLRYNTFGSLAGNYNEAVVYVDWELYDALEQRVVYKRSTEGFAKMSPRTKPAVFKAFNNALRNLLAERTFVDMLRTDRQAPEGDDRREIIRIALGDHDGDILLPDHMEEVLRAVVTVRVGSTVASGFVVSPDGYVITAAHVVSGLEEAQLIFHSGLSLIGKVLRIDNHHDIALLKLPGKGHKSLPLALKSAPSPGSEIYAVGTPYSEELALTVTRGVVSGHRVFNGVPYIQTDASLSPGNSGGPLLNDSGQVVGVVSWKIAAPDFEGLAFGVPFTSVEKSLDISFEQKNGK